MDIKTMVTTWIAENGIGTLGQYDVDAAVRMIATIALEDFGGVVTTIPAELVEGIIESYRRAA